jgi:hypothetical protein
LSFRRWTLNQWPLIAELIDPRREPPDRLAAVDHAPGVEVGLMNAGAAAPACQLEHALGLGTGTTGLATRAEGPAGCAEPLRSAAVAGSATAC